MYSMILLQIWLEYKQNSQSYYLLFQLLIVVPGLWGYSYFTALRKFRIISFVSERREIGRWRVRPWPGVREPLGVTLSPWWETESADP